MISALPPGPSGGGGVVNGQGEGGGEGEEDCKSVLCLQDDEEDIAGSYNVMERLLGKENYNILLSALCSVKDTTLRNKGLAAFFAKNKSFRSIECQTEEENHPRDVQEDQGEEMQREYEDDVSIPEEAESPPLCYSVPVQVVHPTPERSVSPALPPTPPPPPPPPPQPRPVNIVISKCKPPHPVSHVTIIKPTCKIVSSLPRPSSLHVSPRRKLLASPTPTSTPAPSSVTTSEPTLSSTIAKLTSCIVSSETHKSTGSTISPSPINAVTKLMPAVVSSAAPAPSTPSSAPPTPTTARVIKSPRKMIILTPTSAVSSRVVLPSASASSVRGGEASPIIPLPSSPLPSSPLPSSPPASSTLPPTPTPALSQPADLKKELEYDTKGLLEIHRAVIAQDTDSVWMCGENLKRLGCSVDQRTKPEGFTALQLALVRGCGMPLIRVLLWLGADPLARDARGRPTLLLALQPAHRSQSQAMLRPSARHLIRLLTTENLPTFEKACAQTDNQGLTALMHCAIKSWVDGMRLLLFHMPPRLVDTQLTSSGMTALHMAMLTYSTALDNGLPTESSLRCISLLQRSGASDKIPDVEGVTPRQLARTPLIKLSARKANRKPLNNSLSPPRRSLLGNITQASSPSPLKRPNPIENRKTKYIKVDEGVMRNRKLTIKDPVMIYRPAIIPGKSAGGAASRGTQPTQNNINVNHRYILYRHNRVRIRRTVKDIMGDKTFQPVVLLRNCKPVEGKQSQPVEGKQSQPVERKQSKRIAERPQWRVQFKIQKIKKSPKQSPSLSPLSQGGFSNISCTEESYNTAGGGGPSAHTNPNPAQLTNGTVGGRGRGGGPSPSGSTLVAISPKKKWLSRNNKWTEKYGNSSERLKKSILSSIAKKKRRYSLESIGHDVEIIKQAVALQDEVTQPV